MKVVVVFLVLFFSCLFQLNATHIVGGEIFYNCLGGDNYQITLKVYRDCSPNNTNGTQFDTPAPIGIYENGFLYTTLYVDIQTSVPFRW